MHVTANSGFETGGDLYTPVWVEGLMNSERSTFNFGLVDGSSEIPSAYTIDALSVTLYD